MTRGVTVSITLTMVALSVALLANDAREAGSFLPAAGRVAASASHDVCLLDGVQPIERSLARGEEHLYRLALAPGEYAAVIVEQRGIDVAVQLRGTDDIPIADFDDDMGRGGYEQVDVVAGPDGVPTLAVQASVGTVASGSYAIRIATRRPATDADRSIHESRTLRTTAARFEAEGRFDAARRSLERALTITETVRGPHDVQVAAVAIQLAGVYRWLADERRSEQLYQRAIAIRDRVLGSEEPTGALARCQLAAVYGREGEGPKAEALVRRALDALDNAVGANHRAYVSCLITLGNLRDSAGDLEGEAAIVQRALSISETIGDTNSIQYAALLNNLGEVYRQREDYLRAEAVFRRSLGLSERLMGHGNYTVATALQNLGIVARERRDYAAAVEYNRRALSIREGVVGPDHPDVAHILTNLANIYRATGDYTRSLETHLRALRIWENAAGPYQDATLLSVGNIAKTYAAMGDVPHAVAYQRRTDAIVEKQLALNLAVGSERQKLLFVRNVSEPTDRTISLHLAQGRGNPEAAALAALVVLQRKGRVLDALIDTFAPVRRRIANASDQVRLDALNATTAELARMALDGPQAPHADARQKTIADLEARKERLEADLAEHSAEFRARTQSVTLEAVQAAMPDDAVLLEFMVFRPFDPRAERNAQAYGAPHYAAYVVRKHAVPRGLDLGETHAINEVLDGFREALRDPKRTDVKDRARAVEERVIRPLRASFGGATRLLISPDGQLNLVPFEALVDERGRYLIERYAMTYLTSGRDLLRMQSPRENRGKPVIFADPLFGEPAANNAAHEALASRGARRHSVTTGEDLSAVYFAPLAATADEARAIKSLFPDASLFTGSRATKGALQHVEAPRILHIASHGFFLQDVHVGPQNPLLRSGLALAGANFAHDPHHDGLLTALEASGLNLWGTKLVTLSACDSGVGEVQNGEGVYGLRRAFVLAGAETVVVSLWPVSDSIARETMVAYYARLRIGVGRGDALRQAKLAMLKRHGRQHPFYWATFIQSGEWASLDGVR